MITILHIGKLIIENNVEIQAGKNISRGITGDTIAGKNTKIAADCHISHEVKIEENCIIFANVTICGFVLIDSQVWLWPSSTIKEKIKIGNKSYIRITSNIIRDVEPLHVVAGNPARIIENLIHHTWSACLKKNRSILISKRFISI